MTASPSFEGTFKYEANENYEDYLKFLGVPWLKRKADLALCPKITVESDASCGTVRILNEYCAEKTIVLGEEHQEPLPGGESAKAVTVREGDDCLITRIKSPLCMELRREFSPEGMVQYIRLPESGLEASRRFKRCRPPRR